MHAQLLPNQLPVTTPNAATVSSADVPDDPGQQLLPIAKPEPLPQTGVPVRWEAPLQTQSGDIWTLTGGVVLYYKNYVVHADKVVYHQSTALVEAEGHVQLEGGANDAVFTASHGEIHVQDHTASFYDVTGSFGVRRVGKTQIYSTADPFLFTGRVLIQTGEGAYRIVDGTMTACRLPKPDWQLISRSIEVLNDKASTHNSIFKFLNIPVFYFPFIEHNMDENGRESGFLFDGFEDSSTKGLVFGEQVYWVINRSMDLTVGAQLWSKRGFAPNGSFHYKGSGRDNLTVTWNALLDRGITETIPATATTPATEERLNQGGADILAFGRKDLAPNTRIAGNVEYLSSYIYRLAFDPNILQATSSEVQSSLGLIHNYRGFIPSISLERFQTFAGASSTDNAPITNVPEARILHLPSFHFDVVDRPFPGIPSKLSPIYWGMSSSIGDLDRAEPDFHARNVGRLDIYPHLEWPIHLGDWNFRPEFALRSTQYSGSQIPDLLGTNNGVPAVQHNALNRSDLEASIDIRPPVIERDFVLHRFNRELRHVIEPEIFYRYVTGIHDARNTLLFDTTDIATNTNEAGYSLTQRFYLRPLTTTPCNAPAKSEPSKTDPSQNESGKTESETPASEPATNDLQPCKTQSREWISWQIAQKFFIDPTFGGALIPDRRNVFTSTLDLTGVAYLTSPRNIAPVISRLRFEAIDKLRVEWDLDYDTKAGRLNSNNLFAGYSWGRTTAGVNTALLNAADENGSSATVIQSHLLQPFLFLGKPSDVGLSVALNASYDFTHGTLQYGGVEAIYNWNCCGINLGYRRFELGSLRDEGEWLWGFTFAGIGTAGDIHRSNSIFPTPDALSRMY